MYATPTLIIPQGSPMEQAARDLVASAQPFAEFLASLPPSRETSIAQTHMDHALLWAHQVLAKAAGRHRILVAEAGDLPQ